MVKIFVYIFKDVFAIKQSKTDLHFLLDRIQLSHISDISAKLDGVIITLKFNCSGIKVCGGEECKSTVSTNHRINRCSEQLTMQLPFSIRMCVPLMNHVMGTDGS